MLRYPPNLIMETKTGGRSSYPAVRPDFPPHAYAVLTRETGFKSEKFDDKAQLADRRRRGSPGKGLRHLG